MIVRCHQTGPLAGALNMAIDAALASALDEGRIGPTIRFYGWQPHALSLGYHQDAAEVDAALLSARGIDLVRRPTGGKAILHAHEVTYCAVFPLEGTTPRAIYRQINESLIRGLRLLGVEASLSEASDDLRTIYREATAVPCFTSSARSELLVGGKKLVGSAQRRIGRAVLQHGSILIGTAHRAIAEFLSGEALAARSTIEHELEAKTTEIETILARSVRYAEVARALQAGFAASPGIELVEEPLSEELLSLTNVPDHA